MGDMIMDDQIQDNLPLLGGKRRNCCMRMICLLCCCETNDIGIYSHLNNLNEAEIQMFQMQLQKQLELKEKEKKGDEEQGSADN